MPKPSSPDSREVENFSALADQWWDAKGAFAPLHALNPVRLNVIRSMAQTHFGLDPDSVTPFTGLRVIDVGCGGGLVTEPLTRLGAQVTGLDASDDAVTAARIHAELAGLSIHYSHGSVGTFRLETGFDMVLALEVIEHVADPDAFIAACADYVTPGGLLIFSTLNRTLKALALAIVGAEYILGWLPRRTHRFDRFVPPDKMRRALRSAGFDVATDPVGLVYRPSGRRWEQSTDTDVNYMLSASKPRSPGV